MLLLTSIQEKLDCLRAALTGTDANHFFNIDDEDFSVANLTRARARRDRLNDP